jgi:hypothetical protein
MGTALGVVALLAVFWVIGVVATKMGDGIWNGASAAGRAARRGLTGPAPQKPMPLQFRVHMPPTALRDQLLHRIPAEPKAGVVVGLHIKEVSGRSISYAYGDVMSTSFTADLLLQDDSAGSRGWFAIKTWTQCGAEFKDAQVMNDLCRQVDMCVRGLDPAAEIQRLNA